MADLEKLLQKITSLKDEGRNLYIEKYNKAWILSIIRESDQIKLLEQRFKDFESHGIDIIDFVKVFLNMIEHTEKETLYIVLALIDLFKDICESYGLTTHVRCVDLVNYIIDVTTFISAKKLIRSFMCVISRLFTNSRPPVMRFLRGNSLQRNILAPSVPKLEK